MTRLGRIVGPLLFLAVAAIPVSGSAAALQAPRSELAGQSAEAASTGPRAASSAEVARYAGREASSTELQRFEGGEAGVYIGGSVVTALLIVLLILLIL